jgi:hypothetical protein
MVSNMVADALKAHCFQEPIEQHRRVVSANGGANAALGKVAGEVVNQSWFAGDPGWYGFVADALFVAGASRGPADLLQTFLGGPLTVEPLLADLGQAAEAPVTLRPG